LGFELFPSGFTTNKLTRWHNTSTHHNMHHKYFSCNYSLYFNVWDRLMGTNHAKYEETFEEVCERRAKGTEVPSPQTT
jgi:lathosterol oxidase